VWFQNRRAKFRKTERLTQHKSTPVKEGSSPSSSTSPDVVGDTMNNNNQIQHQLQHRIKTELCGPTNEEKGGEKEDRITAQNNAGKLTDYFRFSI
jgi:hypothetical protein